jgi:hypothetical protein
MKIRTRCHTLGALFLTSWILMAAAFPASADETIERNLEYETGFYYTVQKGDTLWDLSQRFSDTPWQWPDLWRENKQLPNPHWIYPGERIRLFRKSDQHRVSEDGVKKETPQNLPQVDAAVHAKSKPQIEFFYGNIDQVGFIRKPPVKPLGSIVKSFGDKRLISKGDIVYIRYADANSSAEFAPGTRINLFRQLRPTEEPNSISAIGTQHLISGVIEITQKEADYAIAKVMKSYSTIFLEDMLMPYESKNPYIPVVDSIPGMNGRIISGEIQTKLIGNYHVAFIDKGIDDKIMPGQIYHVYNPEKASVGSGGKLIEMERVYTGSFLVLHTEKNTSTIVVTHNIQKITPGDRFHTP